MCDESKDLFFPQLIKKSKSFLYNSSGEIESINSSVQKDSSEKQENTEKIKLLEYWIQLIHRVKSHFLPFYILFTMLEHCSGNHDLTTWL